ncbi:MAG TPA: SDR family oxidoreductase [Ktedonosporobacter sp.]|nr:SDR family oxidoreductase [Ktedonosporobacter sp.]
MGMLDGKVAIVTGASRGIGAATALRLAQEGAVVIIGYLHGEAEMREVVHAIHQSGGQAEPVRLDLTEAGAVPALVNATFDRYGSWDILVHCAGIIAYERLAALTEAQLDAQIAINLKAPFLLAREAAQRLASGGRVIFLSSGSTRSAMAGNAAYVATKAAVEMLTKTLAVELGSKEITVNAILPGVTNTRLAPVDPLVRARLIERTPLQRLGEPADIADAVAFLASQQARWITGACLVVSGGLVF